MSEVYSDFDRYTPIAQGHCPNCNRRTILVRTRPVRYAAAAEIVCRSCRWELTTPSLPNAIETAVAGTGASYIPQAVILKMLDLRAKHDEYKALRAETLSLLKRGWRVEPGMLDIALRDFECQTIGWKFLTQHCDLQFVADLRDQVVPQRSTHLHIVPAAKPDTRDLSWMD